MKFINWERKDNFKVELPLTNKVRIAKVLPIV